MFRLAAGRLTLALALLVSTTAICLAFAAKVVCVKNTTGVWASDLHVTFSGTGGNVTVPPGSVIAFGCPVPAVPSNGQITNTATIDWGVPCVPPGATVCFLAVTTGPALDFAGGNWTGPGGVNIGNAMPHAVKEITPPNPDPDEFFWAVCIQQKCVPRGISKYTDWVRPDGAQCWQRECCFAAVDYYDRLVLAFFKKKKGRLFQVGRYIVLSDWAYSFTTPEKKYWQFATIEPEDLGGHEIEIDGTPRIVKIKRVGFMRPQPGGIWNVNVDGGGTDWNAAPNFAQSFGEVFASLNPTETGMIPGFAAICQTLAPGYAAAADKLTALIEQVDDVRASEPEPDLDVLSSTLGFLQANLNSIANDLSDGVPASVTAYSGAAVAMVQIGNLLQLLNPGIQRFANVNTDFQRAAQGFNWAANAVILGIAIPSNQDRFLLGLFNRVRPSMEMISVGLRPHVMIQTTSDPMGWKNSLGEGAQVYVRDETLKRDIDRIVLPISDDGRIFVPTEAYDLTHTLSIGVKFDTTLSFFYPGSEPFDGTIWFMTLKNGDVNEDEVIDPLDANLVTGALGEGGMDSGQHFEQDVNNSGVCDIDDLNQVFANMGQTGGWRNISGQVNLEGWLAPLEAMEVTVEVFTPGDLEPLSSGICRLDAAGNFSMATIMSGPVDIRVKASHWLSSLLSVNLGSNGADILVSLVNGDCDGDNAVTLLDYDLFSSAYDTIPGQVGWDERTDLDGDLQITLLDYDIFSQNYDKVGT